MKLNRRRPWPRMLMLAGTPVLLMLILISGFRIREFEEVRSLEPPVTIRRSSRMAAGWSIILKPGVAGEARTTSRIKAWYGIERSRMEFSSTVTRQPVAEIRMTGTAKENAINAPKLTRVVKTKVMEATGYDPGPHTNSWAYAGTTKLGWRTRKGIVAVDPKVIPLRSLLYIEGYGLAWAGDVGGAIKGDRIDLCFNKTEDALAWGRRKVKVHLLVEVRQKHTAR